MHEDSGSDIDGGLFQRFKSLAGFSHTGTFNCVTSIQVGSVGEGSCLITALTNERVEAIWLLKKNVYTYIFNFLNLILK